MATKTKDEENTERWSSHKEMTDEEQAARDAALDAAEEKEALDAEQVEAAMKAEADMAAEQEKAMEARLKEKPTPTSRSLRAEPEAKPQDDPPKDEAKKK